MSKNIVEIKKGNKGLAVALNMFPLIEKITTEEMAREFFKGQVKHVDTGKIVIFHNAEELISAIGEWQVAKFRQAKANKEVKKAAT